MKIPICPICEVEMKLRKTISGLQFICDNYYKCGGRESYEKMRFL